MFTEFGLSTEVLEEDFVEPSMLLTLMRIAQCGERAAANHNTRPRLLHLPTQWFQLLSFTQRNSQLPVSSTRQDNIEEEAHIISSNSAPVAPWVYERRHASLSAPRVGSGDGGDTDCGPSETTGGGEHSCGTPSDRPPSVAVGDDDVGEAPTPMPVPLASTADATRSTSRLVSIWRLSPRVLQSPSGWLVGMLGFSPRSGPTASTSRAIAGVRARQLAHPRPISPTEPVGLKYQSHHRRRRLSRMMGLQPSSLERESSRIRRNNRLQLIGMLKGTTDIVESEHASVTISVTIELSTLLLLLPPSAKVPTCDSGERRHGRKGEETTQLRTSCT